MQKCDFSLSHYRKTLEKIKETHKFSNFSNCSDNDIILRHDVDVSLKSAQQMAEIENKLGISSTFFILIHAELYNPFSITSSKIIKKIVQLGHNLGLHYDTEFYLQNQLDPTETIKNEIKLLEQHFNTTIKVVSAHDPSLNQKLEIKLPNNILNAYSEEFYVKRKYISDSVQFWRQDCFCKHFQTSSKLQVLIHPIWWSIDNKQRSEIMYQLLENKIEKIKQEINRLTNKYEKYINNLDS